MNGLNFLQIQATAHFVFAIITSLATLGGLVFCGMALAGMTIYLANATHNNPNTPQISQAALTVAYVGTSFAVIIYLFFFSACIYGSVMYCKAPKNLAVYSNVSVPAVS